MPGKYPALGLMMFALVYGNTSKMITCCVYLGADNSCILIQQWRQDLYPGVGDHKVWTIIWKYFEMCTASQKSSIRS